MASNIFFKKDKKLTPLIVYCLYKSIDKKSISNNGISKFEENLKGLQNDDVYSIKTVLT